MARDLLHASLLSVLLLSAPSGPQAQEQARSGGQRQPSIGRGEAQRQLELAVSVDSLAMLEEALGRGADVNAADVDGRTPLMRAATGDMVRALVAKGANPNAKNKDGATALILATTFKRTDVVRALLAAGADVGLTDNSGNTALAHASVQVSAGIGSVEIRDLLRQATAARSVQRGRKPEPNSGRSLFPQPSMAIDRGAQDQVENLLAQGADPNARDDNGMTPLMWAALRGDAGIVRALLAARADVNAGAKNGRTALFQAALGQQLPLPALSKRSHTNTVQALLASGANPNLADSEGMTPLMVAAGSKNPDIARALIAGGADVNTRTSKGMTALALALSLDNSATAQVLIAAGARK